jgi:hypothetical protein
MAQPHYETEKVNHSKLTVCEERRQILTEWLQSLQERRGRLKTLSFISQL